MREHEHGDMTSKVWCRLISGRVIILSPPPHKNNDGLFVPWHAAELCHDTGVWWICSSKMGHHHIGHLLLTRTWISRGSQILCPSPHNHLIWPPWFFPGGLHQRHHVGYVIRVNDMLDICPRIVAALVTVTPEMLNAMYKDQMLVECLPCHKGVEGRGLSVSTDIMKYLSFYTLHQTGCMCYNWM
jgi:hypothetical protein